MLSLFIKDWSICSEKGNWVSKILQIKQTNEALQVD